MLLTDVAIKNRTTIAVIGIIIVLAGSYSYMTLPREAFPDIPIPQIMISTMHEGVSPEDIETSITMKIEKELNSISGVKEITSSSAEGMSLISVEFTPDVPTNVALQRVRDRVDRAKGELPTDAEDPIISEINLAEMPIMYISISGDVSPVQLKGIADKLQDQIEMVPGVLKVEISGDLEPEIRLEFDPERLAMYNLTIAEILALIPSENVNISAGSLETEGTKFNIRIPAELVTAEEVDHLLLTVRNGLPIYLADVANVRAAFKDRTTYSRHTGRDNITRDNITLSIQKRVGANVVFVSDYIKYIIDEAQKIAPGALKFDITYDMAKYIRDIVADLENNILAALIMVVVILLLFLGFRTAIIVAMIIPLSMLITFFLIQALGFTLNMIVLFSLVLVLGMLVDNAIVITENIFRHIHLGYNRMDAAILGAREVAWPVITSTLTTVGAFLPLIFWPGMMGEFMKYLPITLSLGLLSSMFVALVFSPVICSIFLGRVHEEKTTESWFIINYRKLLRLCLGNPGMTLFLALCVLVAMVTIYAKIGKGTEFFPSGDPERAVVSIRSPQGTNINETDRIVRLIEERIAPYQKYIKHTVTNVGSAGGGMDLVASAGGPHLAGITLTFQDFAVRERPSLDVIADIRKDISDIAGAEIKIEQEEDGPPTGEPITVRVMGEDFKTLEQLSSQAQRIIAEVPNVVNLRSDLEAARPELNFTVNRRNAMLLGVNTAIVGNFLKMAVFGSRVGSYRQYNDEYDITVRLPFDRRVNIDEMNLLQVPNAAGRAVPLSSLGEFSYKGGFGTINRVDQKRTVTLTADAEGRLSSDVLLDVQTKLKDNLALPDGYNIDYAGEKETEDESRAFLSKAFGIALFLVTLVLVTQFNSIKVPLIIMTTVILSLIGALIGLLVWDLPFGIIMTGIGVISLAGVVVNNAIVLLAYTQQLQKRGMDLLSAASEAGVTRLRPVLLTAATTIIGLVPMAIGISYDFHSFTWATKSESSQWWRNMAVVVIFGLGFATILTLVVVPSLYVMFTRLSHLFGIKDKQAAHPAIEPEISTL
ncbi:MAG: efflux RND transporter permease subunit [Sedimentisphaerales bacterium]|nr:efflux RND transporter permease subunit [Sedimentisphaerales bacterium]